MFHDNDWKYINEPSSEEFRSFEELVGIYFLALKYINELQGQNYNLLEVINHSIK